MNDVAVVVFSCDKNEELWPIFDHCLNKYWPNHPQTYLLTETLSYPNFQTISLNYDLNSWTKRIRESLSKVKENKLLFICDDCFINKEINETKLKKALKLLDRDNAASINLEMVNDPADLDCDCKGFKIRKNPVNNYMLNLLCGIWNKDKLIDILSSENCSPWALEHKQDHRGYDYYEVVDEKIVSWFNDSPCTGAAIHLGKWNDEAKDFIKSEKLSVDFSKKGFWGKHYWEKTNYLGQKIYLAEQEIEKEKRNIEHLKKEMEKVVIEEALKDIAIVVFSCDKNEELWPVFKHCLEKYWPNHPNTYLLTETMKSKDFLTITKNYDVSSWTKRIRESILEIPEKKLIFICDDCFLNAPVNLSKLGEAINLSNNSNTASINFEILFDPADIPADIEGFRKKTERTLHTVSLLCGLWNKDKLLNILSIKDCSPWQVEQDDEDLGYDYYVTEHDKILSWFRDGPGENAAIRQGKWMHGVEDFAKKENIKIDFEKKGFWSIGYWEKYSELLWRIQTIEREINEKVELAQRYRREIENLIEEEKKK